MPELGGREYFENGKYRQGRYRGKGRDEAGFESWEKWGESCTNRVHNEKKKKRRRGLSWGMRGK